MSPAKNLWRGGGGRGLRKIIGRGVGGVWRVVIIFHEILSRFVKILRVDQKNSKKCHFFAKFSHFLRKKNLGGFKAKDFFRWGVKAKHPPPPPQPPCNHV
jgi:hypothetical protein